MRRAQDFVFEAVDRISGDRYRVDPTDHPEDLLERLAASSWFRIRPIDAPARTTRREGLDPDASIRRGRGGGRRVAGSAREGARVCGDVA